METSRVLRSFGFQVLCTIGEGSYGKVKLATSERHCKEVAIKIMDPIMKAPDFFSKYLPRELAILKKVRHPHIVQVYEIYEMPSREVFIVMEPAVMDLDQKIQELTFIPINQAKTWFSQLLSAMVYLHQQDIAHCDLKCANVLLTADNQVKLTDFGLGCFSRGSPDLTHTGCGTPFYAAPEVLKGELHDPKKSDVWSLGVVLYVMFTGHLPFEVYSWDGLQRAQQEPLKYPEGVRVEEPCQAFISYMLQYNPHTRPSMTEVAQHPWLQSRRERLWKSFRQSLQIRKRKNGQEESSLTRVTYSPRSGETPTPHPPAARVVGRFVVTVVEEDGEGSFNRDVNPLQEDGSSRADASLTCQSIEVTEEEEEYGCFSCYPRGEA
ncbi:testis-specific serine/threonine-protein kinase 6-like [Salminus brasiliensis]|uniref:testis-specific serine/threonine-protein kinase 6-like n=1 Tax=Salminus brasiliensis TaxID=930266 RepID=UPI003B83534A